MKEIETENEKFKTVLRLITSTDNPKYKNSIITFMKIDEREWNRILRNKKILYKSEQIGYNNSRIKIGYSRWKISYSPHADGTDRDFSREMQENCMPAE